ALVLKSEPAAAPALDRLAGTYAFTGPRAAAAGYDARDVQIAGTLDQARVTLDGRATAFGATATARGFIVTPAPGRPLAFDLQGTAAGVDLRRLPKDLGAPPLATHLGVANYHVVADGPAIHGTAALHQSTVEGITIAEGTTGEFALTASTISYGARGGVTNLDLHRLGSALEVDALAKPLYDSRLNGSFDVTGSLPRTPVAPKRRRGAEPAPSAIALMKLDASGRFADSDLMGGRLPDLAFEAHLDQGALTGRADGRFEGFNPAEISGRKDLDGTVSGSVAANFAIRDINAPITVNAVTADGKLALTGSTVGGLHIDTADVDGRYAAQVGEIRKLNVSGPDVKLDASGRMSLDRTTDSNLKYHVEAINTPELAKLAGQTGVGGTAVLDGTLTGNAASLKATGTLNGSNLSYQDNNALDLNSQYTVTVPELDFAKVHVQAATDATFVSIAGNQLNAITATTTYGEQRIDFTTTVTQKTRVLDARGEVLLHPDHQEIHLPQLALQTQGVEWRTAPGSTATVLYGGGGVQLKDVRLVSGDQSLDVSGTLPTATSSTLGGIEVHARNVDLQQIQMLMLQDRGFGGKLTADAKISGTTAAPTIDGHAEIHQGSFQTYHYDSLVANVNYGGPRIGIDATLQQSPTESITAKGSVPASLLSAAPSAGGTGHIEPPAGEGLDLQVTSTAINLAFIQAFTNQLTNIAGTLKADVHVTGSGQDPHLNGFIDIANGAFAVPQAGGTFTGLTTRIDLDQDELRIRKFELIDHNKEKLTISGQLAVHARQVGAVNISIDSDNFEILHNELGDIQVQTRLQVTGEIRKPRIVGSVRLDAARVEVDRLLELFYDPYSVEALPNVVSADRGVESSGSAEEATASALRKAQSGAAPDAAPAAEAAPAPAAPTGTIADNLALDIHLIVPDNLVLRGKNLRPGGPTGTSLGNLNITVGGDLAVRKDPGGPILPVGTIKTVRGTYEFQGRRFDLVRDGTVRLIGTEQIDPLLDVTATRVIPSTGVEARIHITGRASQPELALTSDPPLPESDILALIVFNRPVNELGTGERSSLAATAGGIATGFLAAPLGESIGKALDLDLFEITTTTDTGELGAGVTLGQQVGDRAFVKLRQQFGQNSFTQFQFEYQLAPFLRLQATAAPQTTNSGNRINEHRIERAGVDLIFFFSY
ncbi:MAG: translocation/assembly module TamB domain-containing protein, partial [Acidobacteriota bacterium]